MGMGFNLNTIVLDNLVVRRLGIIYQYIDEPLSEQNAKWRRDNQPIKTCTYDTCLDKNPKLIYPTTKRI